MLWINKVLVIFTTLICFSVQALAQELPKDYTIKYVPSGVACFWKDEPYRCYSLLDAKQLILFDYRYDQLLEINKHYQTMLIVQTKQLQLRLQQLDLKSQNEDILHQEIERISTKWESTDKALQDAKASKDWWKSVVLYSAGGCLLMGFIGGMIVHAAVSN